jgi:hypothetical protein
MWMYVERLENGEWTNTGSTKVSNETFEIFDKSKISKRLVSQPLRDFLKGEYFHTVLAHVPAHPELLGIKGIQFSPEITYRFLFFIGGDHGV